MHDAPGAARPEYICVSRWLRHQFPVDPPDDCTIWYVGDYIRNGGTNHSARIGAFRMPERGGQ